MAVLRVGGVQTRHLPVLQLKLPPWLSRGVLYAQHEVLSQQHVHDHDDVGAGQAQPPLTRRARPVVATTGQPTCSPRRSTARHASKTARGRCPIKIRVRRYREEANVNNRDEPDAFVNIEQTVSPVRKTRL